MSNIEDVDTEELVRFREQWKAELCKAPASAIGTPPQPSTYPSEGTQGVPSTSRVDNYIIKFQANAAQQHKPPPTRHEPSYFSFTLARIISSFPQILSFDPEEEKFAPLKVLPDELIIHILLLFACNKDVTSIERFGSVCRKARRITLDPVIWRQLIAVTYLPPQVPHDLSIYELVDEYNADFRRAYIEQPRVRLDGVYIAVCHYVRPGLSDNPWINVSHLITYHRYLRFLPDGVVISLLANDQHKPAEIIPLLKSTLRMTGLFIGTWHLEGTIIKIRDLMDPNGTFVKYGFQMTLTLRSKPLGRWNKLDIIEYDSVDLVTGDISPLALKHERPFWFSKVRSYLLAT